MIAIKTIKKLGFQVAAAENGKEALNYLLATSRGENPKPDMILMDVQMPIIDGYKCTHLLRHHLPYKNILQDVPIVAMTASAIHGDREKCTRAGMDDYLAKPVTMSILEGMLIRWCLSRRRSPPLQGVPSDCSEMSEHCDTAGIPQTGLEQENLAHEQSPVDDLQTGVRTPKPPTSSGGHASTRPAPKASLQDVAGMPLEVRRQEDEKELSSMLQENKLLDAAGGPSSFGRDAPSFQEPGTGEALTEANINRLRNETRALENADTQVPKSS